MPNQPDFLIIGAMKCATSTLHEQLALQPGIFMTQLKEPNFFSNDQQYAKGQDWYLSLFVAAQPTDLCGESSTHYTKLPTYPHTIDRLVQAYPNIKLIYVMRHPIDRLVSQYIHEWTERVISVEINQAIGQHPELIAYSQYSYQLQPYLETFGPDRILPVFFERFCTESQAELERICQFIGYSGRPQWNDTLGAQNVSQERLRKDRLRDFVVDNPILQVLRRTFVPKSMRDRIRRLWTIQKKPELQPEQLAHLQTVFDQDLKRLGSWLDLDLTCNNFKQVVQNVKPQWIY